MQRKTDLQEQLETLKGLEESVATRTGGQSNTSKSWKREESPNEDTKEAGEDAALWANEPELRRGIFADTNEQGQTTTPSKIRG